MGKLETQLEQLLPTICDFDSFVQGLLAHTLDWPIEQNVKEIEAIGFRWTEDELDAEGLTTRDVKGHVWQIQPLPGGQQPWGIFLLEFDHPDPFTKGRGMVGPLRQVLRGLVPRRKRPGDLPAWRCDNILFICTHKYEHFTFAHFKGERHTSAALSTFGWVRDQSGWRTLCEFNLPKLHWPERPSDHGVWRTQWASAFDKNKLVERFFAEFTEACKGVAADIAAQHAWDESKANTEAQVLLERLLFLYFVQRKGWLNRSRSYLVDEFNRNHRDRPDDTSYTQGFLNVVFRRLGSRKMRRHEEIGWLPFLNGGLFQDDPEAQHERPGLKVTNRTMEGIFKNLLERYNFTIREDTPLDQDVAIDPEMLGKVLECLILTMEKAEGAPDNRKATGSYYTPRIVVHFICREVLRQFLLARLEGENWAVRLNGLFAIDASAGITAGQLEQLRRIISQDDAKSIRHLLYNLKACDPAVGSGAFAVGLLHELVNLTVLCDTIECGRDPRVANLNRVYQLKEHFIEVSLYGVDILERAAEIAKLRLWLSLIVDFQLSVDPFECTPERFAEAIEQDVRPLPNLEFKVRRGDSLLDQIHGHPIRIELLEQDPLARRLLDQLAVHKHDFFGVTEPLKKRSLLRKVIRTKLDLAELFIADQLKPKATIQDDLISTDHPDLREQRTGEAEKRRRRQAEKAQLEKALRDVRATRDELDRLKPGSGSLSDEEEDTLRRLDGQIGERPSFVWKIDFMEVFRRAVPHIGFDVIVGNPPFVHCSDAVQRDKLADRYPHVFDRNAQLAGFFIVRSFDLMSQGGIVGYIVADGFAVARFGEYIVNDFLPSSNLTKVMGTGGFDFEGHGTATIILFAANCAPTGPSVWLANCKKADNTRGDIERRRIWQELLSANGPAPFEGEFFSAKAVSRSLLEKHPWPLNVPGDVEGIETTDAHLSKGGQLPLAAHLRQRIGAMFVTRMDDAFIQPAEVFRRAGLPCEASRPCLEGEFIRDWTTLGSLCALFPYGEDLKVLSESSTLGKAIIQYLTPFRGKLEKRKAFRKTQVEAGLKWWEYNMLMRPQFQALASSHLLAYACITTSQNHWHDLPRGFVTQHSIQVMTLKDERKKAPFLGLLNSSAGCFLMKRRGKPKRQEPDPSDQYYDYDGTAVGRLPLPAVIGEALSGVKDRGGSVKKAEADASLAGLAARLAELARACQLRGCELPRLAMRKLFEKAGEAYADWGQSLPGYERPHAVIAKPFTSADALRRLKGAALVKHLELEGEMVALQEEMDWLVYAAYGLVGDSVVDLDAGAAEMPPPIDKDQRPFVLWARAEGDFDRAIRLVPEEWPHRQQTLWRRRLEAIRDSEHIRRIEQPAYKRRWYRPKDYDQEFIEAFDWWLCEKAEWWLEHEAGGGPVALADWAQALWADERVQAAWPVAAQVYGYLEHARETRRASRTGEVTQHDIERAEVARDAVQPTYAEFARRFKAAVEAETVPAGWPAAVSYEKLAELAKKRKQKVPRCIRQVRGKLNVPRERFRKRGPRGPYEWAGRDLFEDRSR